MDATGYDLHGEALRDYWRGDRDAATILEYRDGRTREIPASVSFRGVDRFFPGEAAALNLCVGKTLVVGGGAGVHALPLQEAGLEVTAIDISAHAAEVMRQRGIKRVMCEDFFAHGGRYDTILLLGRNIGIARTLSGLPGLLAKCRRLLNLNGRVVLNSASESVRESRDEQEGAYPGEIEFRIKYRGMIGPWVRWLHIDYDTLAKYVEQEGCSIERIMSDEDGNFVAVLRLK